MDGRNRPQLVYSDSTPSMRRRFRKLTRIAGERAVPRHLMQARQRQRIAKGIAPELEKVGWEAQITQRLDRPVR